MAKLTEKPNKKQEARQVASDLLQDYDYVYNPGDNTYQLVHKGTGELYAGSQGGLEADAGLLQKNRRSKRLIGEQLSHQRHLTPRTQPSTLIPSATLPTKVEAQEKTDTITEPSVIPSKKSSIDILNKELAEQNVKLKAKPDVSLLNKELEAQLPSNRIFIPSTLEKKSSAYRALGIPDNVYNPGKVYKSMSNINTFYFDKKPNLNELISMKGRGKSYAVYGEKGTQKYVNLQDLQLGQQPKEETIPKGSYLYKAASTTGFHKGTSKKLVKADYRAIPDFSEEYLPQIQRALSSLDKYLKVGDKLFNIEELRAATKRGEGLNDLEKYGKETPEGVEVGPEYFRRGSVSYYINNLPIQLKKCGGKMKMVPKKQTGGDFQISKLDPDELSEKDRFKLWKSGKGDFKTLVKAPAKKEEIQLLEKASVTGETGPELKGKKVGVDLSAGTGIETSSDKAGINKFLNFGSDVFSADTRSLAEKSLNLANPILGAADYFVQRRALKDIEGAEMPRTLETAPQIDVQAAQDLPYEVLVARQNDINRMRSTYKGSDVVAELISKQMVEDSKDKARERLSSDRAAFIADERRRVSQEVGRNQMLSAETDSKNRALTRQYDQADFQRKLSIKERQADLTGQAVGLVAKGIENRVTTKSMADLKAKDIQIKEIDQNISLIEAQMRGLDPNDPAGANQINKLTKSLNTMVNQRSNVLGEARGYYKQFGKNALFGLKDGGKLISKK